MGVLFNLVKEINRQLDAGLTDGNDATIKAAVGDFQRIGGVLGILNQPWQAYFQERSLRLLKEVALSPETIEKLVAERSEARNRKDWQRADEIRNQLEAAGVVLEDKVNGTRWKVAT